jgi:hypothetical protein
MSNTELLSFDEVYETREWVSITELATMSRCPRAFFYKVGCGLTKDAPARCFGTAVHTAIPLAISNDLSSAIKAFDESWLPTGFESLGDKKNNAKLAYKMLADVQKTHTVTSHPYELLVPPKRFDIRECHSQWEVPFAVDIGGEVPLVGRADGLARMKTTGTHWMVEFKTTSEDGERFSNAFEINPQILGYCLAGRMLYPDLNIQGVILESLYKSGVEHKRDGSPTERTIARPIFVRDHHIDSFVKWARWRIAEIKEMERRKDFPQDISGCNAISQYGLPLYNCEFMPLCQPSDWRVHKDLFKVDRHVPFVGLTVKGEHV